MAKPRNEKYVIPLNLCVRCGLCSAFSPPGAIRLNDQKFPVICNPDEVDFALIEKICPGENMDFQLYYKKLFGRSYEPEGFGFGHIEKVYVGYAIDEEIRKAATAGGVITACLKFMLETGAIDGALTAGSDPCDPSKSISRIVRDAKEILKTAQSRYTIIPQLIPLKEMYEKEGQYAIVGLPCHIHGYRKAASQFDKLRKNVSICIGLYCGRTMDMKATRLLMEWSGILKNEVKSINYRAGEWPGNFEVCDFHGRRHLIYKDMFRYLTQLLAPDRCFTCIDYASELSDISVADAWFKSNTSERSWEFPGGQSLVLARTTRGVNLLEEMVRKNILVLQELSLKDPHRSHNGSLQSRKYGGLSWTNQLKKQGVRVPDYGNIQFGSVSKERERLERRRMIVRKILSNSKIQEVLLYILFRMVQFYYGTRHKNNRSLFDKIILRIMRRGKIKLDKLIFYW